MCASPWAMSSAVKSLVCGDAKSNHAPLWSMIDGPTSTLTATIALFFQDIGPRQYNSARSAALSNVAYRNICCI